MNVQIFIPCFIDQLRPETGMNMVKVLRKVGCNVYYNPNQTCCGQPAFHAGYQKEAQAVAEKFLKDFQGTDTIVCPDGSCTAFVRNHLDELFKNSPNTHKAKSTSRRIFEFSEFLVEVRNVTDLGARLPGKATYHDACGALRGCGVQSAPRRLLGHVHDLKLVEMTDSETCCGFGGVFSLKYEPISAGMAQTKITHAIATDATYLISTDSSCLIHLDGYLRQQNIPLRTLHVADVLAHTD